MGSQAANTDELPITAGDVIEVGSDDYRYGVGSLTLQVKGVRGDSLNIGGEPWLEVRGVVVYLNGTLGDERVVSVRMKALPGALVAGRRRLENQRDLWQHKATI